jgi:tetratricopeptide (TPR) repeat protein
MNLATLYVAAGQYAPARRLLDRALQIEQTVKSREARFVGALTMRALLHAHEGETLTATTLLREALEQYPKADHVYAPAFTGTTRNTLGEIAVRQRDPDAAVEHYTAACELCEARPAGVGMGLVLLRGLIGLAKAFRALNMRRDEQQQLARVAAILRGEGGFNCEWVWGASRGQVHYDLASCHAAGGRAPAALGALDSAIDLDWGELPYLVRDEAFARLRREGAIESRIQRVRERGALPEPGPEFWIGTEDL